MSSSPKFRITIQGIAAGARADRVYLALGKKFALSPSQVELLLSNKAGPLVGLMEHQAAWTLRNELLMLGVECRIAPVPRASLDDTGARMTLQGTDVGRPLRQVPRPIRSSRHAMAMRSGKVAPVRPRPRSGWSAFSIPPLLRVAVVVAVAVVVGFSLQMNREHHNDTLVAADSLP